MPRYINLDELLTSVDKRNGRLPLWLDEILMEDCKVSPVEPIRHGEWEYKLPTATLNGAWKCTACKCYFWEHTANEFKYCPNCGAKMDKES